MAAHGLFGRRDPRPAAGLEGIEQLAAPPGRLLRRPGLDRAEAADLEPVSIERAHALRAEDRSWMAELTVEADEGAEDPCALPYLEWVGSELEPHTARVRPTSFELAQTEAHGGTLCLTLDADDVLGLVGTLLTQLAQLRLCAVEMHVETRAGRAHDRIWLATVDGLTPSAAQHEELEQLLRAGQLSGPASEDADDAGAPDATEESA